MKQKKEPLWAIHSVPGRARLRFSKQAAKIPNLDKLMDVKGIEEVTYNKITKSILIIYDENILSFEELLGRIKEKISRIEILQEKLQRIGKPGSEKDMGSLLSQTVYKGAKKTDIAFRKATGNYADIASIIATFLVTYGIVDLFRRPEIPSWDDLVWYGMNMFYWQSKRYG